MTRTFSIGTHIWFVLHFGVDGKMDGLEEHDWREGGSVSKPDGYTWEDYFVQCAGGRASEEKFSNFVEQKARAFLQSNSTTYNLYEDPDLKVFREENGA